MNVGQLVDLTINEILLGTYRTKINRIIADLDGTTGDFFLDFPIDGVGQGTILEIDDELLFVVAATESTKQVSCLRGFRGTVAAAHSAKSYVQINPRFPRILVRDTMREEVDSWGADIYRQTLMDADVGSNVADIDVADATGFDDLIDVLRVWRTEPTTGRMVTIHSYRTEPDIDGPGTCHLYLNHYYGSTGFRLKVARQFDTSVWTFATDLVADVGLSADMQEIAKWGAAWRLVSGREVRRLFTESEGEGRKAEEVPVQANLSAGRVFKQFRDMAYSASVMKLRQRNQAKVRY